MQASEKLLPPGGSLFTLENRNSFMDFGKMLARHAIDRNRCHLLDRTQFVASGAPGQAVDLPRKREGHHARGRTTAPLKCPQGSLSHRLQATTAATRLQPHGQHTTLFPPQA